MNAKSTKATSPLVSADWLKAHLGDDGLRVVDASWYLPAANRNAHEEFCQGHIPGAVYFDIDLHSAPVSLPHMLPDAESFAHSAGSLGIAEYDTIVVYDTAGLFSAARVWWMFRHFGAEKVYVLNGGLPAWKLSGGGIETATFPAIQEAEDGVSSRTRFQVLTTIHQRCQQLVDASAVHDAMLSQSCIIMDARPAGRFQGTEKEARPGLRSGHIPGSVNMPFQQVLNAQGELRSVAELQSLFTTLGLHSELRILTTCGSGVTAAVLCLALLCAGYDNVALYDGSWSEWGALEDMPVATGA